MKLSAGVQESFIMRYKPRWMLCSHKWHVVQTFWSVKCDTNNFPVWPQPLHRWGCQCQGCESGDNGLASCLRGRHPVPGLATLWQLSRNKWGIIGQANESLEGAVWWSILAGLPRQIKWKLSSLWNIISEWVACYLCFVCCGGLVCFWWDFLVA